VDLANNHRVHDLIFGFLRSDKPVAAECYGVACFAFARNLDDRKSIIWGKHVTGHCKEYDYMDGTGFVGVDFNMGPTPWNTFFVMPPAEGAYIGNLARKRRSSLTTRSSLAAQPPIHISPVKRWWKSWTKV
jgi:hypothetical protein